ncbi:hypothetical protein LCER1_G000480 [Lachnellula cervina]|uniref:Uncharacterized protein n=1 Tax=Lachnellula cervina TaxID=1316786 RepID=A0A7D8YY79_9HELO|nr:hypothetical protein LCER1_G000480 [Lachnellula cervina]
MDYLSISQPSLLSLPQRIRQRIYLEAGLAIDCSIDLNWQINRNKWHRSDNESTYSLLLTCRRIYAEASFLVYSTSRFFIRYRDTKSLKALMSLTETSVASLAQLTIHLNVTSCESDGTYSRCCPLGICFQDTTVISEWQRAADYIATCIRPSHLKLYFVCDVEDLKTGHRAVQPLQSLPTLAECYVRLHQLRQPVLQALAVEAATRAMGGQWALIKDSVPFRFMDLPREIRFRILEYTDLVTPVSEVEWNPNDNFYLSFAHDCDEYCDLCEDNFPDGCLPSPHYVCQFHNCFTIEPQQVGCFCHRRHAAFSSKCACWIPPTPLFLVCQDLRQDAEAVFFSKNHFIIAPVNGCTHPVDASPDRLEALIFFKDFLRPTAQLFLRSLEIVFPPFNDDYLRSDDPAYQQWLQVIEHMCQLNLPGLSLSIVMADGPYDRSHEKQFRFPITKDQARTVFRMYLRTLSPLSKLRDNGLQFFFAALTSPYSWDALFLLYDDLDNPVSQTRSRAVEKQISGLTRRVERDVMGQDYDSSRFQGKAHGKSQWWQQQLLHDWAA